MSVRRTVSFALGLIALSFPLALRAAEAKIGFVDQRKAVFSSKEGKEAEKRFNDIVEARWEKLRPHQDDLNRLREEYEKQKYVLSEDALQERRIEIMKRQRELERDSKELEEDLQIEQVKLLQPIQKRLEEVIAKIGEEEGLTLIFDKNSAGLLYFDDSMDVTDILIEKLNKQ